MTKVEVIVEGSDTVVVQKGLGLDMEDSRLEQRWELSDLRQDISVKIYKKSKTVMTPIFREVVEG